MLHTIRRAILVLTIILLTFPVAAAGVQAQDPVEVTFLGTIKPEIGFSRRNAGHNSK